MTIKNGIRPNEELGEMKVCTNCNKHKSVLYFYKNRSSSSGYGVWCKECTSRNKKEYSKTKDGLISGIYTNQRGASRRRGHSMPSYSSTELQEWLYSNDLFHYIYEEWKSNGFNIKYKPSIDRIDDYRGYSLDNIQITTWDKNRSRVFKDKINGVNNKQNKVVIQFSLDGIKLNTYHSISDAFRKTGVDYRNISACCHNKAKSAGGYIWKLK